MNIELRAWDEERKKMLYVGEFPIFYEKDNGFHSGVESAVGDWQSLELMLFTGRKDKLGHKIWQDDIVKINHPQGGDFENTIGRVFYWEEEGAFYHGNTEGRPPKRMWEFATKIGNIYENPDLWEKIQESYKG